MAAPRLLDQYRRALRVRHKSPNTETAYVHYVKDFIRFNKLRHPSEMAEPEVAAYLSWLSTDRRHSPKSQNVALSAVLFLYKHVLGRPLGFVDGIVWAPKRVHVPTVFTREEARAVLDQLSGVEWLMASLVYGSRLRLTECLELRVKDIDFGFHQIVVHDGKGSQDRVTLLPESLEASLRDQIERVRAWQDADLARGGGRLAWAHARTSPPALPSRPEWVDRNPARTPCGAKRPSGRPARPSRRRDGGRVGRDGAHAAGNGVRD
jgi:site-specific recombinase XerD